MGLQWRQPALEASPSSWLAIQVWTGREQLSARHLVQRGYDVFLPTHAERRRWSDRVKTVARPLFAGYVFCRAQHGAVATILGAAGVIRIVGDGGGPIPVPAAEIETIQRLVAARVEVEPWPFLHAGDRVRIEAGPLSGAEGIVLAAGKRQCFIVSVTLLRRSIAVELDGAWLVPAKTS